MPTLVIIGLLAIAFALVGFIIWLGFLCSKRAGYGKRITKVTVLAYLVVVPIFVFFVSPILVSSLISNASTRPDDLELTTNPMTYQRAFSYVSFETEDRVRLEGWFLPGQSTKLPVVFTHGLFRSRQEVLERCCELNSLGYPILLFDLRSHGHSGRSPITLGWQERLDVKAAAAALLERTQSSQVALAGVSMGAVASVLAAREMGPRLKAVILDSPFDTLEETVRRHVWIFLKLPSFPFSDIFIWNLGRLGAFNPDQINSTEAIVKLKDTPLLLIFGEEDERMPPSVGERVLAGQSRDKRQLAVFRGAGHGAAFREDPSRYLEVIDQFLISSTSGLTR